MVKAQGNLGYIAYWPNAAEWAREEDYFCCLWSLCCTVRGSVAYTPACQHYSVVLWGVFLATLCGAEHESGSVRAGGDIKLNDTHHAGFRIAGLHLNLAYGERKGTFI